MDFTLPAAQPAPAHEDYYFEDGKMVFTAAYHLKRGSCCGSSCRHCPYGSPEAENATAAPTIVP